MDAVVTSPNSERLNGNEQEVEAEVTEENNSQTVEEQQTSAKEDKDKAEVEAEVTEENNLQTVENQTDAEKDKEKAEVKAEVTEENNLEKVEKQTNAKVSKAKHSCNTKLTEKKAHESEKSKAGRKTPQTTKKDKPPTTTEDANLPAGESQERLDEELEQEVRYRDTVKWSVKILERSVDDLESQLEAMENEELEEETEFKLRFEAQTNLNTKLEEQIRWYNQEVLKMKERAKRGSKYNYDADLDAMTEFELAQLVKHLEKERNNLYGDLRTKSWLLDSQSKEYYRNRELIKAYTGDLNHINRSLEQIWRERSKSRESGIFSGMNLMTSPGSLHWSGESGIRPSYRILDPRKGPVRKTAGVRSLPRLDQRSLEEYEDLELHRKKRTRSVSHVRSRTKSLEMKKNNGQKKPSQKQPRSSDEVDKDPADTPGATSVEPASDPSEVLTVESVSSSVN